MKSNEIRFPHLKLVLDIIGICASIGLLIILVLNIDYTFQDNGSSEFNITISGTSFIIFTCLLLISLLCACSSYILKRIKIKKT
ncbi:hypothetical protein CD113_08255 [Staphylococcus simiae]|uniref:Uncharacterized protein n=1 Tax=Staphylococcus simiae CCM 7213 = CCUG 51256 TaxID=911238 RepID=G5JFY0_9STAP|nr:hypothetical protein SS7213T_01721 [Staphylococcus simiae CCM 7213 = CCUG 51256]PNZ11500.1 hypothetical protein CD113_08255 [Staphylococcus simiae]SNV65186.1 Uncharacterised protein [Staphylococcus simiae]